MNLTSKNLSFSHSNNTLIITVSYLFFYQNNLFHKQTNINNIIKIIDADITIIIIRLIL